MLKMAEGHLTMRRLCQAWGGAGLGSGRPYWVGRGIERWHWLVPLTGGRCSAIRRNAIFWPSVTGRECPPRCPMSVWHYLNWDGSAQGLPFLSSPLLSVSLCVFGCCLNLLFRCRLYSLERVLFHLSLSHSFACSPSLSLSSSYLFISLSLPLPSSISLLSLHLSPSS